MRPLSANGSISRAFVLVTLLATAFASPSGAQSNNGAPAAPLSLSPLVGGAIDTAKVAAVYRAAAAGDERAMRTMGDVFRFGIGGTIDTDAALGWFAQAAAGGDDYSTGFVSVRAGRCDEALAAYRRAAERGDAAAQSALGALYFGVGPMGASADGSRAMLPADHAESFTWFQRSADQGYFEGLFGLGGLYATGSGVKRDLVEAHTLIAISVDLAGRMALAEHMRSALNSLQGLMSAAQIAEARTRANEWRARFQTRSR